MKRKVFLAVVSLSFCIGVFAQQKRAMTFEDVLAIKSVSDVQVSPDGKWVAYVVTSVDMKENANDADVWLVSTAGGDPIRLTTNKKNDNQPRWSPDGKKIAFISAREEKPQIFLISPFGGEPEKLTDEIRGAIVSVGARRQSYRLCCASGTDSRRREETKGQGRRTGD